MPRTHDGTKTMHSNADPTHTEEYLQQKERSPQRQMTAIWMMVLSCLLFSLMGVFVKLCSADYSSSEIVFYRSVIGMILMLGAVRLQRGSLITEYPSKHLSRSLFGAIALSLWFYAIGQLPLATAMTLSYTAPVWMVLFFMVITKLKRQQKANRLLPMTIIVGFGGIVLMLQPSLNNKQWIDGSIGLLSGFVSAIAFMQIAALGKLGEPGYRVVFYFSLVGVMLGLATALHHGGFTPHSLKGLLLLMAMGLFAAGAQWALTYAFSNGSALVNANLQYLTIAFSSVFGLLFFGDQISSIGMFGMVLIVASGVMATYVQNRQHATQANQA